MHNRGLTLLELIVVMAIITILAGVAIPTLSKQIQHHKPALHAAGSQGFRSPGHETPR